MWMSHTSGILPAPITSYPPITAAGILPKALYLASARSQLAEHYLVGETRFAL